MAGATWWARHAFAGVLAAASLPSIAWAGGTGTVTTFPLPNPTAFHGPDMPIVGPDGNIWFVEYGANLIGRIAPRPPYAITEFALPTTSIGVTQLTVGSDGNIWFVTGGSVDYLLGGTPGTVGRILVDAPNTVTELPAPEPTYTTDRIATGADGALWITASPGKGSPTGAVEKLYRLDPLHPTLTEVPAPSGITVGWLLPGHDRDFWFYGSAGKDQHDVIGRFPLSDSAKAQVWPIPGNQSGPSYVGPTDLIWGSDGNIWLSKWFIVGQFSPALHRFAEVGVYPQAIGLAFGDDGNLWFSDGNNNAPTIDRMRPSYPFQITQYPQGVASGAEGVSHLVAGPDGNLWGTAIGYPQGGAILRIKVAP